MIDSSLLGIWDHGVGRQDWDTYVCNQQSSQNEMALRDVAYFLEYPEMSIPALSRPEIILSIDSIKHFEVSPHEVSG